MSPRSLTPEELEALAKPFLEGAGIPLRVAGPIVFDSNKSAEARSTFAAGKDGITANGVHLKNRNGPAGG
jgi:hypothetical protein